MYDSTSLFPRTPPRKHDQERPSEPTGRQHHSVSPCPNSTARPCSKARTLLVTVQYESYHTIVQKPTYGTRYADALVLARREGLLLFRRPR